MGYSENSNEKSGRKRQYAEDHQSCEDEDMLLSVAATVENHHHKRPKRLCRSGETVESDADLGCYNELEAAEFMRSGAELQCDRFSETDDIVLYSTEKECDTVVCAYDSIFASNGGHQISIEGDLDASGANPSELDYSSRDDHLMPSHDHSLADLQNMKNGWCESEVGCYEQSPLEGLQLFFDDAGLDFGVNGDENLGFPLENNPTEKSESQFCSNGGAEQAFMEENEVHEWLFSGEASPSLGYCTNDLPEPSLAHVLEGMAGS